MKRRAYSGGVDPERMQRLNAEQIAASGPMHPGDIPHRIYNALRREKPEEVVHIWEKDRGEVVAWTLLDPRLVHPDRRRLGMGRTILRGGMVAMASWGMEWAEVIYETDNPGSGPLYRSEGLEPVLKNVLYRKPVSL